MKLKRGAYELDGKILCENCYFKKIKEKNISYTESQKHMIYVDDVREKFGLTEDESTWDTRCKDCGFMIEYDLSTI